MPALVACGRRWQIGSDDFVFPGLGELLVRAFWLTIIVIIFNIHHDSFDCKSGAVVRIFYIGTLVFLSSQILIGGVIVKISMQGSITAVSRRRHLGKVLYVKCLVSLPEVMWLVLGTYWAFDDSTDCGEEMVLAVKLVTLVGWLLLLLGLITVVLVFDPLGHKLHRPTEQQAGVHTDDFAGIDSFTPAARRLWQQRCKGLCFCSGARRDELSNDAFNYIAKLLSDYFLDVDVVPTDIAAGLVLLQQQQKDQPSKLMLENISSSTSIHTPSCPTSNKEGLRSSASTAAAGQEHDRDARHTGVDSQVSGTPDESAVCDRLIDIDVDEVAAAGGSRLPTAADDRSSQPATETTNCDPAQTNPKQVLDRSFSSFGHHSSADQGKPFPNPAEWMTVPNCTYYMRYSLACYTWITYMYMNPCLGCCKIFSQCKCCVCLESNDGVTDDDNCCHCHLAAIQRITGIDEEDFVHINLRNKLYQLPFFVAVDHDMCSVVVAIRGSLSMRDALTDMTAESESVDFVAGVAGPQEVHKGVLLASRHLLRELETKRILEKAFRRGEGYQLVITGYSLGAGIATVLSFLLRDRYPNLHCYAFAPPQIFSKPLSRLTEDFVCSVVLGDDLVPRLSLDTVEILRAQMLRCLRETNQPKYRILAGVCWKLLCGIFMRDTDTSRGPGELEDGPSEVQAPLLPTHSRPRQYTADSLSSQTRDALTAAIAACNSSRMGLTRMYPPGHILFIREATPARRLCGTGIYEATWARGEVFDEILVSPQMVLQHLPDTVLAALKQLDERDYLVSHVLKKRPGVVEQ